MNVIKLSKLVSYILRHKPEDYDITLDAEGWVDLPVLIKHMVEKHPVYTDVNIETFEQIARQSGKQRFEIKHNRIRAYYGHSIKARIERNAVTPPDVLYHGTPKATAELIKAQGMKAMNRQNVHLSTDRQTAEIVAKRWHTEYVILQVDAQRAHAAGVAFYAGNENIWLADHIPPEYIGHSA
ncbi:RNA 2'-phosphotransferase [Marinicella meishanensis]|uniref:RNA 2'-phosphotransferase n=1 Tax=Marinicella meishanensis TaxID=2873263 RepID=UPI001CBA9572|nr:RNA 2'-phosphotransferase [Marinicella sp. NBU2979]